MIAPGITLVHKPVGPTSHSIVRGFMGTLPVCHGGTLDPFAEGLLLILAGEATRLMDLIHPLPKRYVAEVAWGSETDNGDPTGEVTARGDPTALSASTLEAALRPFLGWTEQVPPPTSAKKLGGEPAYQKVHRGEAVELPPSRVYLHQAHWLSHDLPRTSRLELLCRGGYYVRALARDLGRALGSRAHLARLHRAEIGPWADPGPDRTPTVQGPALMPWCASRSLDDDEWRRLKAGNPVPVGRLRQPEWKPPAGYPLPDAPILGINRERLVALLERDRQGLRIGARFRGGL